MNLRQSSASGETRPPRPADSSCPPTDRRRPADELDALKSVTPTFPSIAPLADKYTGLGEVDAYLAYEAGRRDGDRLGWAAGFDAGFIEGAEDAFERVQATISGCTDIWSMPPADELRKRRNDPPITSPCSRRCRVCVTCLRYARHWNETRKHAPVDLAS